MKPLTPEQQAFAEEHHGLLLDFMAKHSLGDDYYDLLANRYLKVVVRYPSEEALRKYSFSTVVWYHLRSELSNYARDQVGKPQEIQSTSVVRTPNIRYDIVSLFTNFPQIRDNFSFIISFSPKKELYGQRSFDIPIQFLYFLV